MITERELDIPALRHLRDNPDGISTSEIIKLLVQEFKPTGYDAEILKDRNDTHFTQKVRNLICHREQKTSLVSRGLIIYGGRGGLNKITKKGIEYLEDNEILIDYVKESGFEESKVRKAINKDYTDIILEDTISEGLQTERKAKHRQRSRKLREMKLRELKQSLIGVSCEACGFDFSIKYNGHGKDYIEIHHLEPVHLMDIEGTKQKLKEALNKVIPLCSNCHRMMHRNRSKVLTLKELQEIINNAKVKPVGVA
ncbi:MAG TPA: HNH endonuclease [Candidatus Nanoarchaeia archaeon]|nr:HNH endonuclease [Candidatus Nanoarchaeia archaeon]